jgi:valyl-tRNA synthetase
MRNIQPWCISRQIWWGHQIPAWYGPDDRVFVEMTEGEAEAAAARHYGKKTALRRDADVLDTWFSSALWPFSTLGWPDETKALARYYPTSVLVTGFDIIFFWVARMAMMGLHFMKEVPFRDVYVHALVRDEKGQKMSKSKGNVLDPLELIDKYGADALRFTLTALAAQGRDIKLSAGRIEGYRNFVTKIWNAARYAEMNGCKPVAGFDPAACTLAVDRWIVGEIAAAAARVTTAIEEYRFNDAAQALYQFAWHSFCDWYLEFTKPVLTGTDEAAKAEVRATTAWLLDRLVELLHPLMPFVTEELWHAFDPDGGRRARLLMLEPWPDFARIRRNEAAASDMEWIIRVITEVRAIRAEMNVPPGAKLTLQYRDATAEARGRLADHRELIERLSRLGAITPMGAALPKGAAQFVVDGASFALPLGEVIDLAKERGRLASGIKTAEQEIARIDGKLGNANFVARAPAEVVEEQRERRAEYAESRAKLAAALERLGAG